MGRRKLWNQVLSQRATMISSMARGYLTRKRLFNLIAKVILIQKNYKHLKKYETKKTRERRTKLMQQRKAAAKVIQGKYLDHQQDKSIKGIKAAEAEGAAAPTQGDVEA